jgi:hypothetical protein
LAAGSSGRLSGATRQPKQAAARQSGVEVDMLNWKVFALAFASAAAVTACATSRMESSGLPRAFPDAGITDNFTLARFDAAGDAARGRPEDMSADEIKATYLACSAEAVRRHLGGDEITFCSTVYDVLLTRHFGGNFDSLLAWSRQQASPGTRADDDPAATGSDGAADAPRRRSRSGVEV